MRIKKLELKNFKRFTDLTIANIPAEAKLVLLIGSNGSGKSSIFDVFSFITKCFQFNSGETEYYGKNNIFPDLLIELDNGDQLGINHAQQLIRPQSPAPVWEKLIGRSSIRIVPRIRNNGNSNLVKNNADAPTSFIDEDTRFNNDLTLYMQQIDDALRAPVFSGQSADTFKIFQDYIQPLNTSLINILGGDNLTTIQIAEYKNPTAQTNGKLIFKKGDSKINYDLLSHGEKQVVILLLNFIVRREFYKDAVIYIDEMDCHLNTSLQSRLLAEIVNVWIPDSSQLWTASHALGFINFAKHADNAAIIDLDLLNFDIPQVITPEPKDSMEVYDIAIPKETIKQILKGYKLVTVENQNDQHYNLALGEKGYLFLPANNNREVFLTIKADPNMIGLRDRDYLRDDEITSIKAMYPNLKILHYYAFENYIYHPDNIAEMGWDRFDRDTYIREIVAQKNDRLLSIVADIATARQTYVEFKEGIKNDSKIDSIIQALKSDELETFYPYYSVKSHYNKAYLHQFDFAIKDLVKTTWFKTRIEGVMNS
ncbi:AAA family ATPase [Chitinophaga varians]|uniref:AAA family ATPase n=1 Tax=Chitinophaga varians TaxID=2202339 RepID=UPI00165EEAF2|nr:AAA family ATPase [Chitinophaga varians]MBC9914781.1 AAA family ATPase [Chitinophaga varians]